MKWSAWKSCSQRCRIILSVTGTLGLELWRATELTVGECSINVRDLQFSRFQYCKKDILIAWVAFHIGALIVRLSEFA